MSQKNESEPILLESYLTVKLGDEFFALDVKRVKEILEVPPITRVPNSANYMSGVINIRGSVLPLVDTRIKFGLTETELELDTCVIVVEIDIENELIPVGVLVDFVLEVIEIDQSSIKPFPSIDVTYPLSFIKGVISIEENFTLILNIDEVFSVTEKHTLKKITT